MRQAESILDDRTAVSASSERCMREFKVKLTRERRPLMTQVFGKP
ncbi:hypothetical protein PPTG_24926 [Phytophthora nicotianae INRA-310]|uniref:Uncharacterized protein n=1 Tax=Phytophthora nicotianae (strain INRA-310) TaxID=761204 RepID=W2P9M6_PHYN3|nr:hypothetical protein PPTG_24926 [Phytophthora nicotianae INRA-310]ETM97526.1 hypothetical protein PPTG_24926 [Phytophthora nicotianae INRA-310]